MRKLKFDVICENFDLFFENKSLDLSERQKEEIPRELLFKMFRRGGQFKSKSTSKLSFITKLYILWRVLKKRWFIVIEDADNGLSVDQFVRLKEMQEDEMPDSHSAETLLTPGTFVLADKELTNAFSYLNHLSTSNAYNYLIKTKNSFLAQNQKGTTSEYECTTFPIREWRNQVIEVAKFLSHYESVKKNFVMGSSILIPEWLVLIALYNGNEVISSQLYRSVYKYAYSSSAPQIKRAFVSLQNQGLIEKKGFKKGATIKITPLGVDKVNNILSKYVINY